VAREPKRGELEVLCATAELSEVGRDAPRLPISYTAAEFPLVGTVVALYRRGVPPNGLGPPPGRPVANVLARLYI